MGEDLLFSTPSSIMKDSMAGVAGLMEMTQSGSTKVLDWYHFADHILPP